MKVKDLMTEKPITITKKDTLGKVAELFMINHMDGVPVVDENGKVITIITKMDIMKAFVDGLLPTEAIGDNFSKIVNIVNMEDHIDDVWTVNEGRMTVVNEKDELVGLFSRTALVEGLYQRQLQEASELKAILNSSNNGIIKVNQEGVITRCNPAATRILDLNDEKIVGLKAKDILQELKLDEILESGQTQYVEKFKFKDKTLIGDRIPLIQDGSISGALMIFKDSSEFEDIVHELNSVQQLSKKLNAVIESSYDGIYITDGNATTLRINKSYERITGLKREKMIGHNMLELEKQGLVSKSATLLVLQNKKINTIEQEFPTGKKVLVTSTPIFDEQGEMIMVVTNVRDVTELAKLREQVEKSKELAKKYYSEIKEMRMKFLDVSDMVAEDKKMLDTLEVAKKVAKVDATVLLLGETGVGKEEVAKFIHKYSLRRKSKFIKTNCGAIPASLIESELFGYEKGAFTGANKEGKPGLFEVADEGTLFLDEVGELPLDMQVKFLRALQEGEIKRVGGTNTIKIDVRIIAATNRNLEEMIQQKKFREDLYYRLNVIPLTILPLRERKEDILPLINHFLGNLNEKYHWNKSFGMDVLDCFYEYDWPGNVRELKNIVERIFVMSSKDVMTLEELPKKFTWGKENKNLVASTETMCLRDAVAKVERDLIDKAFKKHGNVRGAAKELGIDPATFVRKRQKCNVVQK